MATGSARVMMVTAGSDENARAIARVLVDERLAACVNIVGPIRSVYRWREAVEDEPEYMLIIKTRTRLFRSVEQRVRELHRYEVPEIISLPIEAGSKPYLAWLMESTVTSSGAKVRRKSRRSRSAPAAKIRS